MPNIHDIPSVSIQHFIDLAQTTASDTTKVKLGGANGVKTTGWPTWKSTDRAAMDAFVASIRAKYGDAVANGAADRLDYVQHPKALTMRLLRETLADADTAARDLQLAKGERKLLEIIDMQHDPANSQLGKDFDARFAANAGLQKTFSTPGAQSLLKMMVLQSARRSLDNFVHHAIEPGEAGGAPLSDEFLRAGQPITDQRIAQTMDRVVSNCAGALQTAMEHLQNAGIDLNDPAQQKYLPFFRSEKSSSIESAARLIAMLQDQHPQTLESPDSLYREICQRTSRPPQSLLENSEFADGIADGWDAFNQELSQQIGKLTDTAHEGIMQDAIAAAMKDFPGAQALLPDIHSLVQGTAIKTRTLAAPLLSQLDSKTLQDLAQHGAREMLMEKTLTAHFQPLIDAWVKATPGAPAANPLTVSNAMTTLQASAPEIYATLCTSHDPAKLQTAFDAAAKVLEPQIRMNIESDLAEFRAIEQLKSRLAQQAGYKPEELRQLNTRVLTVPLDYLLNDLSVAFAKDPEKKAITPEQFDAQARPLIDKIVKLKTELAASVDQLDAPKSIKDSWRMLVLTNPDLKFPDMLSRAWEIAKTLDARPFEGCGRDASGALVCDAMRYVSQQILQHKSPKEKTFEPFQRQVFDNCLLEAFASRNPQMLDELRKATSLQDAVSTELERTSTLASNKLEELQGDKNTPPAKLEAASWEFRLMQDARQFAFFLYGTATQPL